ncbi:cytochrome P450 6k1-like isoform X2 [Ostrinia furnacalis]|uniref:cytochrome P450 6k1-like isoform X2 n=1 Tax=Ostrinia furnacalis TaxID=93504 RepID=UPI00103B7266|nr:cytochrome P450 6k1-like isoform X2 [Ostrinia furnacalis]
MAVFVILAVCAFCLTYVWYQYRFTYWTRRGVFSPKPVFPFGNIKEVVKRKAQFFQPYCDTYFKYKHLPYVGMYCFHRPVLCVNDLELAKHILIKDFEYFQSRGTFSGGVGDRLAGNLFNIHGPAWKKLRLKMSGMFTSGKLKTVYPMVEKIADDAKDYADSLHTNGESINFSELYGRYAMEIIANIGFGLECNGFKSAKSEFYDRGHGVTGPHDFSFSMDDLAANTMLYMIAGYETSATTGQFTAYQLALNPDIQNKVREEIVRVLDKYGGKCTYEAQNEMVYFNMVLEETMRMYPSMRAIFRRCTKDYRLPGTDLVIEKDTLVFVPCNSIQMDPEIFPEPHKYNPERFSPENKAKLHPCHWMPFGEGPRKCLGVRQGYIQSKMALVKILPKYELVLDERTLVPMRIKTTSLVPQAEGDVWIKLRKLPQKHSS